MAATPLKLTPVTVTGNGPVSFVDPNGNQISIPLAALKNDSGTIKIDPNSAWAKTILGGNLTLANSLVAELQTEGYLSAAPAPATKPAMVLTASSLGLAGNNITVQVPSTDVKYYADPTQTTFSLVGSEKDVYTGLTVGNIAAMVGIDTKPNNPGDPPQGMGLVHVKGVPAASTDLPDNLAATDVTGTIAIKKGANTLFTLETRTGVPAAPKVQVAISSDAVAKTFTLTATWALQVDGISLGQGTGFVETKLAGLAFLFAVGRPASGAYSAPDATLDQALQFSGGSSASAATLVLYAKQ